MIVDDTAPEPPLDRAAAGFRSAIASHAVRFFCKVAGVVVLARLVSPADHGLFAMVATVLFLLALFRDCGLGAAAIQATSLSEGQMTALWWTHLGLGLVLAAIAFAVAPFAAAFYHDPRLVPLLGTASVSFILTGINGWPRTLLQRELRFRETNRIETLGAVLGTVTMIAAGLAGAGAYSFVGFLLASELAMTVATWRLCRWRPVTSADWTGLRPLAPTGLHLTGYNLLLYGLQQVDTLLMGRWFGAAALGHYNRAAQLLVQPMTHLAAPFSQVLVATLARVGPASPDFVKQFRETTNAIAHFTLPIAVACLLLPDEIVRLILGARWAESAPLLLWLAIGSAASLLTATTYALCVASGNAARLAPLTALALAVTASFLWAGRDRGPVGLAAALALANAGLLPVRLWWSSRGTPVGLRDWVRALTGPLAAAGLFGAGLVLGNTLGADVAVVARLALALALGAGSVALGAACFARLRRELKTVASHLPFMRRTAETSAPA